MRHSIWLRALISVWGIWFATALTEPAGFFACPQHHGAVVAVANDGPVDSAHDHHASSGQTGGASLSESAQLSDPDSSTPAEHSCCTCLSQCCTMTPAVAADCGQALEHPVARASAPEPFAQKHFVPLRVAHALPFANGPPLAPLG